MTLTNKQGHSGVEVKIGELMRNVPKATNGNQYTGKMVSDSGVDNQKPKSTVIHETGFTPKQAERFQQLANSLTV